MLYAPHIYKKVFQTPLLLPDQTASCFRPFARRRAITLRPPGLRIRARNPCVRLRFRVRVLDSISKVI